MKQKFLATYKRATLLFFMLMFHALVFAQATNATADSIINKIKPLLLGIAYSITGIVAIFMLIKAAIKYMSKDKNERSEEDSKELKETVIRVVIGSAIVFAAVAITNMIINAVK